MIIKKFLPLLLIVLPLFLSACSSRAVNTEKLESNSKAANVIVLLPVENKTTDVRASQLLRSKLYLELNFKGYQKMPLASIDQKLETLYGPEQGGMKGVVAPQLFKDLLGADAAMYCTLTESRVNIKLFYAPVTVAASCSLRSTHTGEVLWTAQYKSTSRNFDFTGKRLEMKSSEAFEATMEEVVHKVMETLPDGPRLRG